MHCGHCGTEATHRCVGCKNMHYCTLECQQADWRIHKLLCKQFAAFEDKPDEDVRRVIVLPGDSKPVFAWVSATYYKGDIPPGATGTSQVPTGSNFVTSNVLGEEQTKAEALLVSGYAGSRQLFEHSVSLVHRDYFMDAPPNKCVASLLGKDVAEHWRGPLFTAAAVKNVQLDPFQKLDIDTTTFSIALNALREFTSRFANGPP